ncbi:hypothetical protein RF11_05393 [Thelohanellus kitauei]|uniref:Uncharacterized protein n=1 Tax=Thelohanellus kitauei TaxID=669202 RepID=A0A0C2IQV5_THEKT|nr:hypothetical protein RF11_05393 [Thelohanellus kitauei]
MTSQKFYKIHIFAGDDRRPVNLSRIWCSYGALFVYDEDIHYILMKIKKDEEFRGHRFSKLEDIYLDQFENNKLALLTKSQDMHDSNFVSLQASNPNWFNKNQLFFLCKRYN